MQQALLSYLLITLFAAHAATGQEVARRELEAVARVDLGRYVGKWYEIAKYPNRFQKDCLANTTAEYTLKDNGRIEVQNSCVKKNGTTKTARGEAKIIDKRTNAKLEVRFAPGFLSWLPIVWGDYWVIELGRDYEYSVIGHPKRDYFWILSRKPTMDDATYQAILRRAEANGFQPGRVEKTPQGADVLKGYVMIKN